MGVDAGLPDQVKLVRLGLFLSLGHAFDSDDPARMDGQDFLVEARAHSDTGGGRLLLTSRADSDDGARQGAALLLAPAEVEGNDGPLDDGGFQALRRVTDDVAEVRNGMECGVRLGDFNEYEINDIIECYELEKIAQTL